MGNISYSQGRPSSLPMTRRTARYSVFKDRRRLRGCLYRAPEAKDETGWPESHPLETGRLSVCALPGPVKPSNYPAFRGSTVVSVGARSRFRIPKGEARESPLPHLYKVGAAPQDQGGVLDTPSV